MEGENPRDARFAMKKQGSKSFRARALAVSRWLTAVLVVAVTVPLGTVMLADGQPNAWLASGAAMFLYTWGVHQLAKAVWPQGSRRFWRLRAWFIAQMVTSVLCAIGAVIYGGVIGVLGAISAVAWFVFSLWLVQLLTWTIHAAAPTTPH
jgi:hypothetical protein